MGFFESERGADEGYSSQDASLQAYRASLARRAKNKRTGHGDVARELNVSNLVLHPLSFRMLAAVGNRSRAGEPNVAVRGETSARVCANSGLGHCVALGCPSLLLNPDVGLGATLQAKWAAVRTRLDPHRAEDSDGRSSSVRPLRLAFQMPARWSEELARLFVSVGHQFPDFVVILQMPRDADAVRRLRRMGLPIADAQVKFFTSVRPWLLELRGCDLQIGGRIHGTLAAVAASTPAVVVATDMRIDEMAQRMGLPSARAHHLAAGNASLERLDVTGWPG